MFTIPSSLPAASLTSPETVPVELNDLDVDRMMTHIMELAVKHGRIAQSSPKEDPQLADLAHQLSTSAHLSGFDSARGCEVLAGWLGATVVKLGARGRGRGAKRIDYLQPRTIASYRSGLPVMRSRNRRAELLVHHAMREALAIEGDERPEESIARLFIDAFGAGVDVGVSPWARPGYDGSQKIDINALLSLRFVEQFPGNANLSRVRSVAEVAVPGAVQPMGRDLVGFLRHRPPSLPASQAMGHLSALISLRLMQLPLRIGTALRCLLNGEEARDVESDRAANPCEQYVDFTRRRGEPSDELSAQCVMRDLDQLRMFLRDRLLLRSVLQALELVPELGRKARTLTPPQLLVVLVEWRQHTMVQMALRMQLSQIEQALPSEDEGAEGRALITRVREVAVDAADAIATVLVEGLGKKGIDNQVKWFYSTGGITKDYGLLTGVLTSRLSWRYSAGDDLLQALLPLCFVEDDGTVTRRRLPITTVLTRLEQRFGLLVDRPPTAFDSAEARAGAAANLDAFSRKLQLLGCFQGLSDDLSARYVTNPLETL